MHLNDNRPWASGNQVKVNNKSTKIFVRCGDAFNLACGQSSFYLADINYTPVGKIGINKNSLVSFKSLLESEAKSDPSILNIKLSKNDIQEIEILIDHKPNNIIIGNIILRYIKNKNISLEK